MRAVPYYKTKPEFCQVTTGPIETITSMLENKDQQFHERLGKNDNLKLAIDVDKLREKNSKKDLEAIFTDVASFLGVGADEISYTTNFAVESGSHHLVIPRFWMSSLKQKQMWNSFRDAFGYGKEIDADILGRDGWFRLPNQTKERVVGTAHKIQRGKMEDFVLKHIPEGCTEFAWEPKKEEKKPKKKIVVETPDETTSKKTMDKIYKMVKEIPEYFSEREKWLKLALIIWNESDGDITGWELFYQLSKDEIPNFVGKDDCYNVWKAIKPKPKSSQVKLGSLVLIYKEEIKKKNGEEADGLTKMKRDFEMNHCKIINKAIFVKRTDEKNIFFTEKGLLTAYAHLAYEVPFFDKDGIYKGVKKESFIKHWISFENEDILRKEELDCYPNAHLCPENIYNTWIPFEMEKLAGTPYCDAPVGKEFLLHHISILCNHQASVSDYIVKWIAQMIQYPEVKTIMPTFISGEGAGKGSFLNMMRGLLGETKLLETTKPSEHVFGNFNELMADCFLVNLNELSKKEMMHAEGYMKGLITDNALTINIKGGMKYKSKSYHRFISFYNDAVDKEDPIKTTKGDRRNLIIKSSDEKMGDAAYFEKMREYIADVNVLRTLYDYFKSIPDMDKFHQIPLPLTEYQENMKKENTSFVEKWLENFTYENQEETAVEKTGSELYSLWEMWRLENGIEIPINSQQLGKRLLKIGVGLEKKHTRIGVAYTFNITVLKKHFGIGLLI
jgi:hypothetical protein